VVGDPPCFHEPVKCRVDTDPKATVAVAPSIYSHLPHSGTPLWGRFKVVGKADPAAALAALACAQ